jgi:uncharacterized protein (UPF0218 family)
MRGEKMPFGNLMDEKTMLSVIINCENLITVGDVVSMTALRNGLRPKLMIYDFCTERQVMDQLAGILQSVEGTRIRIVNPPGRIMPELVFGVKEAFKRSGTTKMQVDGEEDLAAPVCAAFAPLGACMLYGMPKKGIVFVKINKRVREQARSLIKSMEESN